MYSYLRMTLCLCVNLRAKHEKVFASRNVVVGSCSEANR